MQKLNGREKRILAALLLLILIAMACRHLPIRSSALRLVPGALRVSIYIGIVTAWAFSIRQRILSAKVKKYLLCSAALMIFWLILRTVKYNIPNSFAALNRYCWYGYYIPLLIIPLLGVFAAVCINRAEDYTPPQWMKLLCIPTLLAVGVVVTNDLHQTVFVFPNGVLNCGNDYGYGPLYFAVVLLIAAEVTAFIGLLWKESRLPGRHRRLLLPLLPPFLGLLYTAAYIMQLSVVRQIASDITATFCVIMIFTYEACIRMRLIPSNTRYDELFGASTIAAQITDERYRVLFASDTDMRIGADVLRQTERAPVMLPGNIRLSGAPIAGGHVVWQEDMTELITVLDNLRDVKECLEDGNDLLREENKLKTREALIAVQGRLYDLIQRDTEQQITLLSKLTDAFEQAESEDARKKILKKMIVVGAYIKRRSNLILSGDRTPFLSKSEVALTFEESLSNLELYGVDCAIRIDTREPLPASHVAAMYDLFEKVAEGFDMSALTAVIESDGDTDRITLNTDSAADIATLASAAVTVLRDEDGEWQITGCLRRGGEAL